VPPPPPPKPSASLRDRRIEREITEQKAAIANEKDVVAKLQKEIKNEASNAHDKLRIKEQQNEIFRLERQIQEREQLINKLEGEL